jgi:hypothetical protein
LEKHEHDTLPRVFLDTRFTANISGIFIGQIKEY